MGNNIAIEDANSHSKAGPNVHSLGNELLSVVGGWWVCWVYPSGEVFWFGGGLWGDFGNWQNRRAGS